MKFTHAPRRAAAIAGLAMILLAGFATGAKAAATVYAVSGVLTWSSTNSDTIAGSFTYNPIGNVASMDLTLTSTSTSGVSQEAGTWNGAANYSAAGPFVMLSQAGPANFYIVFGSDLTSLPATETITGATWICGFGCRADTTSVTATVSSAPEPGSLVLFTTALALFSLAGRARFRQAGAMVQHLFGTSRSTAWAAAA
jgi:hypothetical protein